MLSKLTEITLRNLFRIPFLIGLISYIRFIYFLKIKKKFKTLYPLDDEIISKRENKKYDELKNLSKSKGDQITALNTNLHHKLNVFNNIFYNISQRFAGQRSTMMIAPLKSLDFISFNNSKILSIGPRTEGEIFNLVGHGFHIKNIEAIDLQTYSNVIKLGDMLNIPHGNNKFDIVICGWVLSYTNEVQKAINEIIRVTKNNGFVCIGISNNENKITKIPLASSNEIISYFGSSVKNIFFKYHPNDIIKKTPRQLNSLRSIIVLEIKK